MRFTLAFPSLFVLSHHQGFVTADMIKQVLPAPGPETVILGCGPPPMMKFACKANLDQLGYEKGDQLYF
jgi:cytochrome-b5 reductase